MEVAHSVVINNSTRRHYPIAVIVLKEIKMHNDTIISKEKDSEKYFQNMWVG